MNRHDLKSLALAGKTAPASVLPEDPGSSLFREPYERLRAEFDAVPESQLLTLNLDIPLAVTIVLGALPALRDLRAEIITELPHFDRARFDRLEDYARAAAHAHALFLAAQVPAARLSQLARQAAALRDSLLVAADALADRGVFPHERIAGMRRGKSYRDTCTDLLTLSAIFRDTWKSIGGRTAVQIAELDYAESLASELLVAVSRRRQTDPTVLAASTARRRAATLFVNTYDQARRAATYLRWNMDDADTLVPSVYVRAAPSKKRARNAAGTDAGEAGTGSPPALAPATRPAGTDVPVVASAPSFAQGDPPAQ